MKLTKLAVIMALATSLPLGAENLKSGIKLENMDLTIKPADDFYQYACGGWMKNHPLPAAYGRYGAFDMLAESGNKRINDILTELSHGTYTQGTVEQKVSDLYKLAMDSVRRNKDGVTPVLPEINKLEGINDPESMLEWLMEQCAEGDYYLFNAGFGADEKNSKENILSIYQGGLTLRQKDYYTENDSATIAIREAYVKHMSKMFQLFGFNKEVAQKKAEAVLKVENKIAQFSLTRTELRDVEKNYNKMTLKEFTRNYPYLFLDQQLEASGIDLKYCQELVVGQPKFCEGMNELVTQMSMNDAKAYLQWNIINSTAGILSDEVMAENFDFNGRVLSGRKENHPRWRLATNLVQGLLGEPLGRIYVDRYFPASSKERMKTLVSNLQKSLGERIQAQTWLSEETKKVALEKLSTFYVKIGYPDTWKDYTKLTIDASKSLYENIKVAHKFLFKRHLEETVGKPVNRDEWHMTPQTVNAYYNPTTNEICFPAGILQYPFFDPDADDAFNYGAIGVVIGHEMTHGFDDQGSHFDKDGNMKDWWKKEDVENFKKLGDQCADFFDQIEVLPGVKANGRMTLGENMADHGGLEVSFNAYKNATKNKPLPVIDGLTADQRFFIAYAGVWGQNITEKEIRNRLKNDVHSQGEWRVKGALPHINAWYKAFNVKKGDKMYLPEEKRLKLW